MHVHDHTPEQDDSSLRPRSGRVDRDEAALWRAAAAGRTDVLGRDGLLHMQRVVGNDRVRSLVDEERSPVLDVVGSGRGAPLEDPVRADMEARFGHDFGHVRVHTDSVASESAKAVDAHAYTVGSDIVFQRGQYDPGSTAGRTMLAHELTHVVQQASGPVDGTPTGDGVRVSDPSDRFEREAAAHAERVVAEPAPAVSRSPEEASTPGPAVQRDVAPAEDEEAVQESAVQRDATAPQEELEEEQSA